VRFTTKNEREQRREEIPKARKIKHLPSSFLFGHRESPELGQGLPPQSLSSAHRQWQSTILQSADDFLEREGGREEEKGQIALKGSNKTMGI
jgi:hypothetical protein